MLQTLNVEVKDLGNLNGLRNPSDTFRRCFNLACHGLTFVRSLHSHANSKSFDPIIKINSYIKKLNKQ
jgi:hypothetical protein